MNISVSVGCLQSYSPDQGLHYVYLWLGVVLVDLLVFVLTLKKTVELKRAYKRTSLWEVVMRDGVLYFAVITFINAANIVVFAFGQVCFVDVSFHPEIIFFVELHETSPFESC
ncbi:hypothetical protein K435DRAFT_127077 [Dendrothele bispora CBS 962.96]|uniref:Uncharacterized protein n=1 Tax=Dendrothele bispora (strain CBS 962.96) TaxID=1314807 RepID=A0A4S8KNM1_DENBC|nr:hypothetical protein K435DRAFT_127077 [Dendrothele bispora CBS 962.96]